MTGEPYTQIVQQRILDPLAMTSSTGAIVNTTRPRLAVGYSPYFDDRPWKPAHGYVPATWFETNTGDGCQACTAADLAAYLRMFLNRGAAPNGRVLSKDGFARMTTPHTELGEGEPTATVSISPRRTDGSAWVTAGAWLDTSRPCSEIPRRASASSP